MHPLALKTGVPPPPPPTENQCTHKNVQYFFYDSDESQVEQKPIFHSGFVMSYIVNIHSWNLYFW